MDLAAWIPSSKGVPHSRTLSTHASPKPLSPRTQRPKSEPLTMFEHREVSTSPRNMCLPGQRGTCLGACSGVCQLGSAGSCLWGCSRPASLGGGTGFPTPMRSCLAAASGSTPLLLCTTGSHCIWGPPTTSLVVQGLGSSGVGGPSWGFREESALELLCTVEANQWASVPCCCLICVSGDQILVAQVPVPPWSTQSSKLARSLIAIQIVVGLVGQVIYILQDLCDRTISARLQRSAVERTKADAHLPDSVELRVAVVQPLLLASHVMQIRKREGKPDSESLYAATKPHYALQSWAAGLGF